MFRTTGVIMKRERNENRKLPEPIKNATPEQVAKAIMQKPPKKEWRFMSKNKNEIKIV